MISGDFGDKSGWQTVKNRLFCAIASIILGTALRPRCMTPVHTRAAARPRVIPGVFRSFPRRCKRPAAQAMAVVYCAKLGAAIGSGCVVMPWHGFYFCTAAKPVPSPVTSQTLEQYPTPASIT